MPKSLFSKVHRRFTFVVSIIKIELVMKTLVKGILVLALLLGTFSSHANGELNEVPSFKYLDKGHYISVSDASGDIIYTGQINYKGNISALFDFSKLKNGIYKVEITRDFEIEINTIEVKDNSVIFLKGLQKKIHKPVFRSENAKLIISKLALNDKDMKVELYYEDDLIHSETVTGDKILNRVYRLDETYRGKYTAIVRSDDCVFVENFRI